MTDLSLIAPKLANFLRLLASDKDGEVVAAARAMVRTLQGIGADIHDVADRVEHSGNGALSEAKMQEIFGAGIKEGIRRSGQARHAVSAAPQFPSARDMAMFCYRNIDELDRDWEREFVTNMASWTRARPLSVKQQAHLEKIYIKLGGKI
jgi:hypothetical protein